MASEKMAGKKRGKKARRTVVDMTMEQVGKIREERSQSKQEEVSVWGPYRDGPNRFRLKISEKGEVRNVCYKTREEAVKAQLTMLTAACERAEHDFGNEIGAHNAGFKKSGTAFANSAKAMVGDARRRLASIEALYFGVDESEVDSDDDE